MNLYNLLRLLIKSGAQTGGLTAAQAYDGLNLVDRLEAVHGFGQTVRATFGTHEYRPINHYFADAPCGLCGKERELHVSG